jgi:ABC-type transport system substrate-binding protein
LRAPASCVFFGFVIRFFVYGPPVVLVALIVASFVNVALLTGTKKNEMTVGMLGEPSTLNPIKSADGAASTVQASLFNGLLKYDQNLEITTDLAESFSLSQQTTCFFKDENAALSALLEVETSRLRWREWTVTGAKLDDNALIIRLDQPGMDASLQIASLFDKEAMVPLHVVRIETAAPATEPLERIRASMGGGRLVRLWQESPTAFEVTVLGEREEAAAGVARFFERFPELEAKISVVEEIPFLAEPEVVFDLREDVRWHDGAPLTSRDPAFTYRAIMDPAVASPRKPDFDMILEVATPTDHRFVVTYRKPFSPALNSWMMAVLPAHLLEGKPQEWWVKHFDRSPVGTGPFVFDIWKTNEYLRLRRNASYFDAPGPWLDAMVYRVLADQLALRLAFETRQVDFWAVDPWAVSSFEKDPRFELFSMAGNSYTYVGWNLRREMFRDHRIRLALAHAVNVPEMVAHILYGHGTQSTGIFTPQMWFFNPSITPIAHDPARARELLAEAGWIPGPDGILARDGRRFAFTLITNSGNETRRDIATIVQDNFRAIGIEVKIEMYEWAVFLRNFVNKGEFDAIVLGWALGADFDQFQIWHSSQSNPEQLNVVSYNNPVVDRLLEQIRQEYARPKIIAMARDLQRIIFDDQPYLFLYVPRSTSVFWKGSFRIKRPDPAGDGWLDTPIEMTKAGWGYYQDWFYRPDFPPDLP